jgi:DNA invertase Pin-like site-specific DNA recombinase
MGYDLQKGAFKIPRQNEPLLAFDPSELYSKPSVAEVIEARSIKAAMAFEARYNAARLQRLKDAIETLAPEETLSLDLEPQTARVFGYVRVSTAEQDSALQRNALMELKRPPVEIIEDVMSGARADRPGLDRALSLLRPGDTLAIWKLDRLGRSLRQLIDTAETIRDKGASLHSITESLDTSTPAGRVLFHVLGALAEFERDTIRDRVTAGMKAAKKAGKHVGRPARMSLSRTEEARRMLNEGKSWNKVCTTLEISQPTLSRALRKYGI